ncbi:MAG: ferrochelatase [Candidatus Omnitrophica bacterium]|nr:ferrochelatase [Candidatus Omnitrophota bacterium]
MTHHAYAYLVLALVSFLVNIPCGYIRENHPKFSLKWFLWIHASIPLIVYLRITFGTSPWFIPVCIPLAIAGQVSGSRRRKKTMSPQEKDHLRQIPPIDFACKEKIDEAKTAVVLLNMGGPRTNADVRDFQRRLFSDPLLIRFPLACLLQGLFAWLLVTFRAKTVMKRYQLIGGGSPVFESTRCQAQALREELLRRGRRMDVTLAFNYSPPFPEEVMRSLQQAGKDTALLLSLYPHYSKATTGSSVHYLKEAAKKIYPDAGFKETPPYYLHDGYIQAFADRVHEQIKLGESLDDFYLLFSAHGLPLYFLTEGDLYPFQISQTVARILGKLNRSKDWTISYQSAVGPLQWLKPSTEDMIEALIRRGFKKLLIVPVSFVTDHIETSCEIDIEYRHFARKLGAGDFRMSRAVDCHPGFIRALADSVEAAL